MPIGEAVLSAFMQALFEKVIATAFGELKLPQDVAEELEKLSSSLSTIQAHVEDAEERQLKDKAARSWLAKLKDVAYEMDDLLDDYAAEALRSKQEGPSRDNHLSKVRSCFCCFWFNTCLFNHKILQDIKKVEEKLNRLVQEREIIGPNMIRATDRKELKERPQTSSIIDDSSVFGREEDKETIVKMLLDQNNSNHANLSILPIVGMGGLGKTTLTQLVYNDTRIKEHFQLRVWLCVSENFDQMKLTKETIESVASEFESTISWVSSVTTNMNLLQEDLSKKLKGKRFLLVLDDVWNEDPEKWGTYRRALLTGGKGSRIVVTTRNKNVGKLMGGMTPYYLNQLSDNDCWSLFRSYAFVDGNSNAHPNLEMIGMEIVKKLKGLPLAAKAIGSLLCSQDTEDDWKNVLRSEIWELPSDKNNILPALRLSYNHLPAILKRCFAFCSVFHKDYVFEKDKLVQIWMALGFIQPQRRRRMEEIGSSYFDELLSRSFFQHHKGGYVMHDAMHDLAQSVSIHEYLRLDDLPNNSSSARSARHLSFSCENRSETSFEAFLGFKRARTLLLLSGYKSMTRSVPSDLFLKLRYLHVLDLNRRDITELPDSIGSLKMLRYLNLSGTGIAMLPSSIGRLFSLQILKLKNCHQLDCLPQSITNLVNLRWLEARTELVTGIARIGKLTCLQQLDEFVVRTDKGYKISELKEMKEIRGHICIKNIECVASIEEAIGAFLSEKAFISILDLIWSDNRHIASEEANQDKRILEVLRPHHELNELTVKAFAGSSFPNWFGSLSHLQTLHLSDCTKCSTLPALGELPQLKYLDIGGFPAIIQISQDFSGTNGVNGFPALKELVFEDMSNFKRWASVQDGEFLPSLTELVVVDCPKITEFPLLPSMLVKLKVSETGFTILPEVHIPNSQFPSSLECLQIHQCPNLTSLQEGLLSQQLLALQQLTITQCLDLIDLPVEGFRSLSALKSLHIYDCPRLAPSGQHSLLPSKLEDLRISSCSNLINPLLQELNQLSSLTHLTTADCASLQSFPVKLPATLQKLEILDCINLIYLPAGLEDASCLTTITILKCPLIPCLPGRLTGSLKELYIKECPFLLESCQENSGRDWCNIAHVPIIEISDDTNITNKSTRRRLS
ncbi:Putative disease resistance protein RGA3 [Triticum urartu]|uniref:Putative disease resistance protein RGA3 n=1 Tax=Triticum urartu TaxID=4572 RepID=M7Z039_TRIUA|nr:disease resistance protein RGA2-like [Triticum urartu]EMS56468.1 Putative disease resistance protein RGA3 [Triticum urartu]